MLTNWKTISNSIRRLRELEGRLSEGTVGLTKKETLQLTRERDKLERALGGIKDMGGLPDLIFVVDTNKESIAVAEAKTLNIPVVAVLDSNSDPEGISYPIPGNDDASRAINLYCDLMVSAVLDGLQAEMAASGADMGAFEAPPEEIESALPEEVAAADEAPAPEAADEAAAPEAEPATEAGPAAEKEPAAKDEPAPGAAAARADDEPRGTAAAE
jgi:small subunit ribosomal protein S2